MDFTIDTEQKALRDAVRELAGSLADNAPSTGDVPVGPNEHDEKAWSALAEMGVLGLTVPEELGGMGATPVELMLAVQELGKARVQTALPEAVLAAGLLAELGNDEQKGLLEGVSSGETLIVPAIHEPMRAFSLEAHDVTATESGDGWSLSGTKAPVRYAAAADRLLVTARAGEQTGVFLVEGATAEGDVVTLDGASAQLVGSLDGAGEALQRAVNVSTVALLSEALGAMEAALAMTTEYLKSRKQFGVPIMTFQTLTQRAADMYVSVELARSAVQFAAMVAAEDPGATDHIRRARVVVGKAGRHVGQEAIQLHGGIGMTAEYAVGHYTSRLAAIEHTLGDTRQTIGELAKTVRDHGAVDVFA
ncbi:acyl-CoA dehydrogenase family protein [Actinomycetota bacterium]